MPFNFSFVGTNQRGLAPKKNFEDSQKHLDAISCFAAKGCSPDDVYTCTRDVRKQINPSVKAQLLRSALILLSLVTFNQDIFCQTSTPTATVTPSPTATATPSPTSTACSIPTPGACTSYEAESSNNTLQGSAFVLSCPTCSGGFKVGYVGNNSGTLKFNLLHQRRRGALRASERERRSRNACELSVHWLVSDCRVKTDNDHFEHRLQHA